MRIKVAITLGVLAAIALGFATVSVMATPQIASPTKLHVIEHATTDTVIDTGLPGDTTGDLLTFHNAVFNATDAKRVGRDQGDCIRIAPSHGSWECRWVTRVPGGSITVEGPFFDAQNSVLAVTGGTGIYRNVRGTMGLQARNGGAEYDFIFNLVP
jgi:hypothetical protein